MSDDVVKVVSWASLGIDHILENVRESKRPFTDVYSDDYGTDPDTLTLVPLNTLTIVGAKIGDFHCLPPIQFGVEIKPCGNWGPVTILVDDKGNHWMGHHVYETFQ